jgi:hypothetical protein
MHVEEKLAIRPMPLTLYLRRSLLWQLWRFVVINLRMTLMILKSHDTALARSKAPVRVPTPSIPANK